MDDFVHESVMTRETLGFLQPRSGGVYADATLGVGGHSQAILDASAPDGRLFAIDRDPQALARAGQRLANYGERAQLVHGEFRDLPRLLQEAGLSLIDGLVADLGVSSPQLDDGARGFSFQHEGPLDMRMDNSQGETVLELIARLPEHELAHVLFHFGEERRSRPIARSIRAALAAGALSTTARRRSAVVMSEPAASAARIERAIGRERRSSPQW